MHEVQRLRLHLMMKSLFLFPILTLAFASLPLAAETPPPTQERVFVCAHSFMIYTAKLLPSMAKAAGLPYVSAGQQMIGGSKVIQHWNLPDEKNKAKAALRQGSVDVLTLSPHMFLPDPGIDNFTKLGLEKNPNLRVLVQASWPARDGSLDSAFTNETRNSITQDGLNLMQSGQKERWLSALESQVQTLNTSVGREAVHIVPVNEAVFELRRRILDGKVPGLAKQTDLFSDALGHPQPPLAFLVTYCHFAAIYQRSPVGLPVPAGYENFPQAAELNRVLQEIAWDAVSRYPMSGVKAVTAPSPAPATTTAS